MSSWKHFFSLFTFLFSLYFVSLQAKREKYGTKLGQEPKNVLFHS